MVTKKEKEQASDRSGSGARGKAGLQDLQD